MSSSGLQHTWEITQTCPILLQSVIKKVYVTVFKLQRAVCHHLSRKELKQDQVIFMKIIFQALMISGLHVSGQTKGLKC